MLSIPDSNEPPEAVKKVPELVVAVKYVPVDPDLSERGYVPGKQTLPSGGVWSLSKIIPIVSGRSATGDIASTRYLAKF